MRNRLTALFLSLFLVVPAFAQTTQDVSVTVQTGVIVGHKAVFTTAYHQKVSTRIIKNVSQSSCVAEADSLASAYQTNELQQASAYGHSDWEPRSYAVCATFTVDGQTSVEVPPMMTITVDAVCEVDYDTNSQLSASQQLDAACPVP